jgi:invasion protein IalB
MIRKLIAIAAATAAALLVAGPATASTATAQGKTVASCWARGDYATCGAAATVNHPLRLYVHVAASPAQRVSGAWDVTCSKGYGAGTESGSFSGRTTLTRKLRMSYRRPDFCIVSADAQLSNGGHSIHVWLTAVRS